MGTLGLAYVGSPRANSHGGVCPKGKLSVRGGFAGVASRWVMLQLCTEQAICLFPFSLAYYSPIGKKNIYLNSGLTSTKNYGKTILTKVCFFIF